MKFSVDFILNLNDDFVSQFMPRGPMHVERSVLSGKEETNIFCVAPHVAVYFCQRIYNHQNENSLRE